MTLAFVDESERGRSYYFLGALVCDDRQARELSNELESIVAKHGQAFPSINEDVELHAYEIMSGRGVWRSIPARVRFQLFHEVLKAVASSGACVHIEGIDIQKQKDRGYRHVIPARELVFSHLLERISECAREKGEPAKVYADEHHTSKESESNFAYYQQHGTYGFRSSRLEWIDPEMTFMDSRQSRLLQAADMVTYLYNRYKTIAENDERAQREKTLMWLELRPAIQRGGARIWP